MRFTKSLGLLFGAAVCNAQISKPRAGDVLQPNQQFEVEWQTAGLQPPINIDLVPSGKTDLSVIAEKIAVQVDNVGRLNWNPSASITAFVSFAIVITDSVQAVVVSESFQISQLTQQPVNQTILREDSAQVETVTVAAGPPKVVYSGALPPDAVPAGIAVAAAIPTEGAPFKPAESALLDKDPADGVKNGISNGTVPEFSPSRQEGGGSKKAPAPSSSATTDEKAAPLPDEQGVPGNSSKPLTSIGEKNQTPSAPETTPTPEYSTIQSAPASFPTLSATKNQTGLPGPEVTPTPIYSTIADSGPAFPSLSANKNQTAPANAEATPTPIYSTLPDTPSSFPTLPPTNNQTTPSAGQPAKSKAPAATLPAEVEVPVPANRTSIVPEAPATPSLPIVTLPAPNNTTVPATSAAPLPSVATEPPVFPSATNPLLNSTAPTGLPAIPVPVAAPSPSNVPINGTADTKPQPFDPAPAISSSSALPYRGTLPADGGTTLKPIKSDVPASTTDGPTSTFGKDSATPLPSSGEGGKKGSKKGGDGGSGGGNGDKSGDKSDSDNSSGKGSGDGSDTESDSEFGSSSGIDTDGNRSGTSDSAAIVPTPQPQLGGSSGATRVIQIGPIITLPSSLWTSMILATAAGVGAAAPTGGLFAVAASPAVLVSSAGFRTTEGDYFAAFLSAVTVLVVTVM
ncbi:hypothetical protein CORC01_03306 [Colletotrichum orchidophilum]|uniref:Uncharacterized protein n=1 Tax=Colletotrichum orchidophilum TaxID=1209926 RepID=A0A1G4BJ01_9PEZI|nr:uncharacterized protein CORC01_03306 [Colletotrichum orchidophilum]OHF01273.1 hypothetical protein CORC01_03306 [Colletotrichum orchidophilum]